MTALIKIWCIPRHNIMLKKCLMLRKYSHGIMQSGIEQEAKLNKQHNSILLKVLNNRKEICQYINCSFYMVEL